MKPHGYMLKDPKGRLIGRTFGPSKAEVWRWSWVIVADTLPAEWRNRYWKRPYSASARRKGWRVVPVRLVEIKK